MFEERNVSRTGIVPYRILMLPGLLRIVSPRISTTPWPYRVVSIRIANAQNHAMMPHRRTKAFAHSSPAQPSPTVTHRLAHAYNGHLRPRCWARRARDLSPAQHAAQNPRATELLISGRLLARIEHSVALPLQLTAGGRLLLAIVAMLGTIYASLTAKTASTWYRVGTR